METPVIDHLHKELAAIVPTADFKQAMERNRADAIGNTPEQFAKLISGESARYVKVVKAIGLKLD